MVLLRWDWLAPLRRSVPLAVGALTKQRKKIATQPAFFILYPRLASELAAGYKTKKDVFRHLLAVVLWELTDSNRRPSACKADALNQLS